VFEETYRLQALLARLALLHAVLARWDRSAHSEERLLAATSLSAWRGLRAVAGLLAAHPHPRFHPGPIRPHRVATRLRAAGIAIVRGRTTARLRWLTAELENLTRVVADIRAVSRAPAVSDACSRIHEQFKLLGHTARSEDRDCAVRERDCAVRERLKKARAAGAVDPRQTPASRLSSSESI